MKTNCSIVVVYDDSASRQRAMNLCDGLMERFWSERDFSVSWCSCAMLERATDASEAITKAGQADFVVIALQGERVLPDTVHNWMEKWLSRRGEREGTLIDLSGQEPDECQAGIERHLYLRQAAHRGGMDYLTREPQTISHSIPDSLDSVTERAERVTMVLDEILHSLPAPPSFPLVT